MIPVSMLVEFHQQYAFCASLVFYLFILRNSCETENTYFFSMPNFAVYGVFFFGEFVCNIRLVFSSLTNISLFFGSLLPWNCVVLNCFNASTFCVLKLASICSTICSCFYKRIVINILLLNRKK